MKKIPYGRQSISDGDRAAVDGVLQSDWLTQGPKVDEFEATLARAVGARYAVSVTSGTAALHIAALAAGIGPGKTVWTSPNTFVASAACAFYCGGEVDFVDVDPSDGNLSVEALRSKLEDADKAGRLPDVLIPVHYAGHSCDMAPIGELAAQYGVKVVEDACHAIGGTYRGEPVGNCRYSDMAIFSFHPVKNVTTGEGGAITTNSESLWRKLRLLRNHGITREEDLMETAPDGPWSYQQIDLGFNYRLTDIQAALGLSQLERLSTFVARRSEIAARYDRSLEALPVRPLRRRADTASAYHLYPVAIDERRCGTSRLDVYNALQDMGVGVQVHYIPVHTQPLFQRKGFRRGDFPQAEAFYRNTISLPVYPDLDDRQQSYVIECLGRALAP